jgi:hypothetical protein
MFAGSLPERLQRLRPDRGLVLLYSGHANRATRNEYEIIPDSAMPLNNFGSHTTYSWGGCRSSIWRLICI